MIHGLLFVAMLLVIINFNIKVFNLFILIVRTFFEPSLIPFFHGHVFNDVTTMTSSDDEQTSHQEVSDVGNRPNVQPRLRIAKIIQKIYIQF
jgi:hypothetical protein